MQRHSIVAFKNSGEKYAEPEIYICRNEEENAIQTLLDQVCSEGSGPIDSLTDKEFAFKAEPITLAKLRERFSEELEAAELDAAE